MQHSERESPHMKKDGVVDGSNEQQDLHSRYQRLCQTKS